MDHLAYLSIGLVGGLLALRSGSAITVGVISSFTIYSSQFSKPFIELSGITTQIQTAFSGLERAFELIDQPEETPDEPNAYALNPATIKGEVAFNHVSFSYEPSQRLIENFSFVAKPGQTIAIVGKTGAGKSTLVNLLMRFMMRQVELLRSTGMIFEISKEIACEKALEWFYKILGSLTVR